MKKHRPSLILDEFVKYLKQMRIEKGLSHAALAKKSGVTRSAISHIEAGNRKPSLLVALRIAEAMDAELSGILRRIENTLK